MKKEKRWILWIKILNVFIAVLLCLCNLKMQTYAESFHYPLDEDGELIVVIDPGHGGENLGADYNGYVEKEMNMIVANAMYEELTKYEGVTVYMTRDEDIDLSLKKRAQFAREVNADFLFCLHFNMSAENNLYGSEVWVELRGDENRQGYAFATVQLEEMAELGLFIRGAKTRIGESGNDYYGILRHCKTYGIAAALIEHCHVDNENDTSFCDSREDLEALGRADATAAAKYFGLSSKELGVDYSEYVLPVELDENTEYVLHDITEPEVSELQLLKCDYENRTVSLEFRAADKETVMLYYAYSVDGGETFSECFPWPETDIISGTAPESFQFTIDMEPGTIPRIVARAYNKYDRYTDSNVLTGFAEFPALKTEENPVSREKGEETDETANDESGEGSTDDRADSEEVSAGGTVSGDTFADNFGGKILLFVTENKLLSILIGALLVVCLFLTGLLLKGRKRNKRR